MERDSTCDASTVIDNPVSPVAEQSEASVTVTPSTVDSNTTKASRAVSTCASSPAGNVSCATPVAGNASMSTPVWHSPSESDSLPPVAGQVNSQTTRVDATPRAGPKSDRGSRVIDCFCLVYCKHLHASSACHGSGPIAIKE